MSALERYLSKPVDPASHGYCECGWSVRGEWAHRRAHAHGQALGHVTHIHEPPVENPVENL